MPGQAQENGQMDLAQGLEKVAGHDLEPDKGEQEEDVTEPFHGYADQCGIGGEHGSRRLGEQLDEQESESGDGGTHFDS